MAYSHDKSFFSILRKKKLFYQCKVVSSLVYKVNKCSKYPWSGINLKKLPKQPVIIPHPTIKILIKPYLQILTGKYSGWAFCQRAQRSGVANRRPRPHRRCGWRANSRPGTWPHSPRSATRAPASHPAALRRALKAPSTSPLSS